MRARVLSCAALWARGCVVMVLLLASACEEPPPPMPDMAGEVDLAMASTGDMAQSPMDLGPRDLAGLPKLNVTFGSGAGRASNGTLHTLIGQPIGGSFAAPGGRKIEPGLLPQTNAR